MRIKPGTPTKEVYASLSKRQQRLLSNIQTAREREAEDVRAVMHRQREAVRKALEVGVPVRLICALIEVTPARVYQMRDEAIAFASEKQA